MTYIHDFRFFLSDSSFVDAIIEYNANTFDAELILPPLPPNPSRFLNRASTSFQTAADAFNWVVQEILAYATSNSLSIAWVDNPCNTPFISETEQTSVFQTKGITVTLLVNGKK
ncbi:hypothetical protein AA16373_2010 [Komagataeibacter swingsii DSM 16373]|nr:hypothetical protein AA16373_2010 [Komagataeibacter swingsii DSM 16373]